METENAMDTEGSSKPPEEVRTPRRAESTVVDLSGMKAETEGGLDMEVEDLSLGFDHDK